jgi:hypothetical protein
VTVIDCAGSATEPVFPLAAKVAWPRVVAAGISVGAWAVSMGIRPASVIVAFVAFLAAICEDTAMLSTPPSLLVTAAGKAIASLSSVMSSGWFTGHEVAVVAVTDTAAAPALWP